MLCLASLPLLLPLFGFFFPLQTELRLAEHCLGSRLPERKREKNALVCSVLVVNPLTRTSCDAPQPKVMAKEGAIVLGVGGDNSPWGSGKCTVHVRVRFERRSMLVFRHFFEQFRCAVLTGVRACSLTSLCIRQARSTKA